MPNDPTVPVGTLPACIWCGASRAEQMSGRSFYTSEGDPLCAACWDEEYGGESADEPEVLGWTPEQLADMRRCALAGDIQSAADLLRRNGWTVTPPQEVRNAE